MNQAIQDFISLKQIAIVGVSRTEKKMGYTIVKELTGKGYETFIVHSDAKEIGGMVCYPNLAALKGKVGGVVVCVPPVQSITVLKDAAAAGIKNVWLQMGSDSKEVLKLADN